MVIASSGESLDLSKLFIGFDVRQTNEKTQNHGQVFVYNLNESTAKAVEINASDLELSAGYGDNLQVLTNSSIRRVETERQGLDRITTITFGDVPVQKIGKFIVLDIAENTSIKTIIREIVRKMDLEIGSLHQVPEENWDGYFSWYDTASAALDTVLNPFPDIQWYVQDGIVEFSKRAKVNEVRSSFETINITPAAGLIGSPTVLDDGVRVRSLLRPEIKVDSQVRITAEFVERTMKVVAVNHKGDNRLGEFFTDLDLREVG